MTINPICSRLALSAAVLITMSWGASAGGDNVGDSSWNIRLGGSVFAKPKYEGSNTYEVGGFPIVVPEFNASASGGFGNRVKFRGLDDIRFRALSAGGFEIGPVAGYRSGRDQDDGRLLGGLGDIDGGLVLGGYVGYRLGYVLLDAAASTAVTGDNSGFQFRFGAESTYHIYDRIEFTGRVGATYASDDYMDTYFGVTAPQAKASMAGLSAFDASSGFKDIHVELGTKIELTTSLNLLLGARYARLIGDAADSPVIETADQFSGSIGLSYKFNFGG